MSKHILIGGFRAYPLPGAAGGLRVSRATAKEIYGGTLPARGYEGAVDFAGGVYWLARTQHEGRTCWYLRKAEKAAANS